MYGELARAKSGVAENVHYSAQRVRLYSRQEQLFFFDGSGSVCFLGLDGLRTLLLNRLVGATQGLNRRYVEGVGCMSYSQ